MLTSSLNNDLKTHEIINLKNYNDKRGSLFEIFRFSDWKDVTKGLFYSFTINPDNRRGDHYHLKKHEWFTCVHGRVNVLINDTNEKLFEYQLDAEKPQLIYIPPEHSHALLNTEKNNQAVVLSYSSTEHDQENPDTFYKFVK